MTATMAEGEAAQRLAVVAHNLALRSEARALTLRMSGLRHAFVKGAVLAGELYPDLSARPMSDIDLLVHPRDVDEALRRLLASGYEPHPAHNLDHDRMWAHETPLRAPRAGGEVTVDLHWHLLHPERFTLSDEDVWSRLRSVDVDGVHVTTTDETLTLVHLAAHYAVHHCRNERSLIDFRLAMDRWRARVSFAELWSLAERSGLEGALALAWRATGQGDAVVPATARRRARVAAALVRLGAPSPRGVDVLGHVALLALVSGKLRVRSVRSILLDRLRCASR